MALIPPQLQAYARTLKLISLAAVAVALFGGGWYVRDLQASEEKLDAEMEFNTRLGKVIEEGKKAVAAERALRMEYKDKVDRMSTELRQQGTVRDAKLTELQGALADSIRSGKPGSNVYSLPIPQEDFTRWKQARAFAESPSASSPP
jgi:hypothetical protein